MKALSLILALVSSSAFANVGPGDVGSADGDGKAAVCADAAVENAHAFVKMNTMKLVPEAQLLQSAKRLKLISRDNGIEGAEDSGTPPTELWEVTLKYLLDGSEFETNPVQVKLTFTDDFTCVAVGVRNGTVSFDEARSNNAAKIKTPGLARKLQRANELTSQRKPTAAMRAEAMVLAKDLVNIGLKNIPAGDSAAIVRALEKLTPMALK